MDAAVAWPHPAIALSVRCKGLGGGLLRHKLTQLDLSGTPAYLEASIHRSRALYHRLGFTDLHQPITLADGPDLYPMGRPAGAPPTTGRVDTTSASPNGPAEDVRRDAAADEPDPAFSGGWMSGPCVGGSDGRSAATMGWVNQHR